jgi:N-(2-amino-2-carboxyethyl)-L-glutamate synthase
MTDRSMTERIEVIGRHLGRTKTVRLRHPAVRLFAKMECANPTGSAKDRAAYQILRGAIERGEITRGTTVVESSSGNFALSLAFFCRMLKIPFVPVLDSNVNASTEQALRRSCDRVEKVTRDDAAGGFLLSRLNRVGELMAEIDDAYWPDQYSNADGAHGHYELTGAELAESLRQIDYLFVGVGTGATVAGLSQRIAESSPGVTVIAVDVEGSVILGGQPRRRYIPGIGSSIRPPLVDKAVISDSVIVSELDEATGCQLFLRDQGILAGGSTGGVYAAVNRYFSGYRGRPPVVAFLCADRGGPYLDTVYNRQWVAANLGPRLAGG